MAGRKTALKYNTFPGMTSRRQRAAAAKALAKAPSPPSPMKDGPSVSPSDLVAGQELADLTDYQTYGCGGGRRLFRKGLPE